MPAVPPRPSKANKDSKASGAESSSPPKLPPIPPRPTKQADRSKSPLRDTYSPLNDSPFSTPGLNPPAGLYNYGNNSSHSLHVPQAVPLNPTVIMPTIGQEGSEYANIDPSVTVELAKPAFRQHVKDEMNGSRPGMKQRFPSSDIWEDAPASVHLSTELTTPDPEDDQEPEPTAVIPSKQVISPPQSLGGGSARSSRDLHSPAKPHLSSHLPSHLREEMSSGRPSIKQRFPSKDIWEESPDSVHLSAEVATPDEPEEVEVKTKEGPPAIPPRPNRNKLASVKAGFLSDLNSRLGAGPPIPKIVRAVEDDEKAPFNDARKGRAKGPSRRKPAVEAIPGGTTPGKPSEEKLAFSKITPLWTMSGDGKVSTTAEEQEHSTDLSRRTTAADSATSDGLAISRSSTKEANSDETARRTPLPDSELNSPTIETEDAGLVTTLSK